jgi:hypothetical protein
MYCTVHTRRTQRRCSNCTVGTVGIFAVRMLSSSHWGRWINPVSHCQGHTYVNLLFGRNIAHQVFKFNKSVCFALGVSLFRDAFLTCF